MRTTGMVRKLDELGRIVIPSEMRRTFGLAEREAMELFTDGDKIILKKYQANMQCVITGEVSEDNHVINGIVLSNDGANIMLSALQNKLRGF